MRSSSMSMSKSSAETAARSSGDLMMERRPAWDARLMTGGDAAARRSSKHARVRPNVPKKNVRTVISACLSNGVCSTFPKSVGSL